MTRYFSIFILLLVSASVSGQKLSAEQLLDKAISYHDPSGLWNAFKGNLQITMSTPDKKERLSTVTLNLPKQYFKLVSSKEDNTITQILDKGECTLALNGSSNISEEDIKTHSLNCERAIVMKDYYTYLYGLPMKLKDPGTLISPKVIHKSFKGKEYLVIKVNYTEDVGKDVWYFYFDPNTFAMEVYQFYHDESKNDGEYILLTGEENASGIKMPKTRAWYYNKDNKYLGTDVLTKTTPL